MKSTPWYLDPDRYFDPEPTQRKIARELYETVKELPLICPHGHVDPGLFARHDATFGTPVELLIIPDHYIFRMLYSQGIPLEALGIPRNDGQAVEPDPRKIWQTFADHFYLFRGTPSGMWLAQELSEVFDVQQKLSTGSAQEIYDQIEAKLASPEFSPRALFERFNIEVLCTTDAATSPLEQHRAIRASGWPADIRPTFRPDALINLDTPGWKEQIEKLAPVSGVTVTSYAAFIQALEERRQFFRSMGATACDHGVSSALTTSLSLDQAEKIFQRALHGEATPEDARVFTAHMLVESARMSDESIYSRELAPLAGHYPALRLGPPGGSTTVSTASSVTLMGCWKLPDCTTWPASMMTRALFSRSLPVTMFGAG